MCIGLKSDTGDAIDLAGDDATALRVLRKLVERQSGPPIYTLMAVLVKLQGDSRSGLCPKQILERMVTLRGFTRPVGLSLLVSITNKSYIDLVA